MGSTHLLTGHHHYKFTSMNTLWGLLTHSRDTITINSHPWILHGVYLPTHGTPPLQINIHGYSMGPTYQLTGHHHYKITSMDTLWGLLTGHHHYKFTSMDTLWGLLTYSRDTTTTNPHPWILYGVYSRDTTTTNSHAWILYGVYSYSRDTMTINSHPWLLYGAYLPTHGTPSL